MLDVEVTHERIPMLRCSCSCVPLESRPARRIVARKQLSSQRECCTSTMSAQIRGVTILTMKTASLGMLALLLLSACGLRVRAPQASWDARVGVLTYADAVHELGEPIAVDSRESGVVAVWEKAPRGRVCLGACAAGAGGFSDGMARSRQQQRGGVYVESARAPVVVKKDSHTLVFGADRVLVGWSRR